MFGYVLMLHYTSSPSQSNKRQHENPLQKEAADKTGGDTPQGTPPPNSLLPRSRRVTLATATHAVCTPQHIEIFHAFSLFFGFS